MPLEINTVYAGDYLRAADLQGREVTLTISDAGTDTFDDGKTQVILSFEKTAKRLGLNKTNANTIANDLGYGTDALRWIGKKITVFPTTTEFQGKNVPCIRIRFGPPNGFQQPAPAVQQQSVAGINDNPIGTPAAEDDIPF